jgi:serine/threonine protein kinase
MPAPTTHDDWVEFNEETQKFDCTHDDCSKSFKNKRSCVTHYKEKHVPTPVFACSHCNKSLSSAKVLKQHLKGGRCQGLRNKAWNLDEAQTALLERSSTRKLKKDPMRRNTMKTKVLPAVIDDLLTKYVLWEENKVGDVFRPSKISKLTINGYKSHIKKWMEYVTDLVIKTEEDEEIEWTKYIPQFCESGFGSEFMTATFSIQGHEIRSIDTIRNYCWALMCWTKFCLSRKAANNKLFESVRVDRVNEFWSWAQRTAQNFATEAKHNKLIHNNLDYMKENNRWII